MIDRIVRSLYWPALLLGWVDVLVLATSPFHFVEGAIRAALDVSAGLGAILFCLMLLDRDTGRAIWTANYLMRQRPRGRFGGPRLLDPEWGFFGSVWRDRRLMWCNRALFVEAAICILLSGASPKAMAPAMLAFAGFAVTMLTLFLQLKTVVDPDGPKPSSIL